LKLLETASASVCGKMAAANPQFADTVQDAITEVIDEINLEFRSQSPDHVRAKTKVRRLRYWKDLDDANVHKAARAQNFEQTVMVLSALASCPIEMVERAILNENPGTVQIIAKVARCSWATVKAVLLMTAADRRMSEGELARVRENYERLEIQTAERMLEFCKVRRGVQTFAGPPVVPGMSANREAVMR
jgi:uncharacterized lipoprotein YajG